jgi:nitroreductase
MELSEAIRRRRMVRSYDRDRPVPDAVVDAMLRNAIRAPSAGFSQGWDFLVLREPGAVATFWAATSTPGEQVDSWLRGMRDAPVLIICLSDKRTYLDRYAEPDKGWTDRDEGRWPVPYWDVDTGMAAMLMLLTAVDEGLGSCFFGVEPARHDDLRAALAIPPDRTPVGVLSLGYAAPDRRSPSLKRGRRGLDQVAHEGRFGTPYAPGPAPDGQWHSAPR